MKNTTKKPTNQKISAAGVQKNARLFCSGRGTHSGQKPNKKR